MVDDTKKKGRAAKSTMKIAKPTPVSAKPEVSDLIALRLRKLYDTVAEQPVPDRFMDLLNQLDAASASKKSD